MSTNVPAGYKQTEVGLIPEDWRATTVSAEAELVTGFPFQSAGFSQSGVRLLRGSNVKRGAIDWGSDITEHWPSTTPKIQKYEMQCGDVVIAMDGALVGRSYAVVTADDLPALLVQRVARIRSQTADTRLLGAWIGSERFVRYVDSVKTHTAIPHISPRDIREFPIALPSESKEQHAIAQALSDVEALLGELDRLIAKKRDLKQAAMQQLLTGQTRLPGFSGEWEMKRLGDVTDTDPENLGSTTRPDFMFNYISLEDVDQGTLRGCSEQVFRTAPSRARRKLRDKDVLVSTVRPNLKSHLLFRDDGRTWVCSTGFCVVRCREKETHPGYIFFHMFAHPVARQIEALLTGSNYPAINSGDVRALKIPVPAFDEQAAIATILSDMDAELAALEQRRDKTRALKQATMQELLTGRIRLV